MTNKITEANAVFYLETIKANAFQLQGLFLHQGFFGCQGEIEMLSIYTNFATLNIHMWIIRSKWGYLWILMCAYWWR